MAPLTNIELKALYSFCNRCAKPNNKTPLRMPIANRPISFIQSLSIANFTKKLIPKTSITIPILLIKFSPINFSKSGLFFWNFWELQLCKLVLNF